MFKRQKSYNQLQTIKEAPQQNSKDTNNEILQKKFDVQNQKRMSYEKSMPLKFGDEGNTASQNFFSNNQDKNQKQQNQKNQIQEKLFNVNEEELTPIQKNIGSFNQPSSHQDKGRSLTKTQSQNKLLLQGKHKDPSLQSSSGQELLFKHHQFSSATGQQRLSGGTYQLRQTNQHILSHCSSTKECTFCNKTLAMNSKSWAVNMCSGIFCKHNQLGTMIQGNLSKKYSTNRDYYNVKIVNDLIYNENTHVVSIFKDYLILDDINEFLKRSYNYQTTKERLPKLCSFYDKYSQVFPNYVVLPESKYMFKNIQKKQKLIDEVYQIQEEQAKKVHQTLLDDDRLFSSRFYNSVYILNDISMSRQQYEDQAKQIGGKGGKQAVGIQRRIEEMKIDELVDRFLLKDSESNIQLHTTAGIDFTQSIIATDRTPGKSSGSKPNIKQNAQNNQISTKNTTKQPIQSNNVKSYQQVTQKKSSMEQASSSQRKPVNSQQQQNNVYQVSGQSNTQLANAVKKQKGSFQNQMKGQPQIITNPAKLETSKVSSASSNQYNLMSANMGSTSSNKTTPRLKKQGAAYTGMSGSAQTVNEAQMQQQIASSQSTQQIQSSPATKEAIANYLQMCQIEQDSQRNQHIQVLETCNAGNGVETTYESPSIKSPNGSTQKFLLTQTSQTVLSQHQTSQFSSTQQNPHRVAMKSQCTIPTSQIGTQKIANLKKSNHRLSSGGQATNSGLANTGSSKITGYKKTQPNFISPTPSSQNLMSNYGTIQQSQQQTIVGNMSRNIGGHNSTQKSSKSINSHAKYLSGGHDHYQKMLVNNQNNVFVTQDSSKGINNSKDKFSSNKKDFGSTLQKGKSGALRNEDKLQKQYMQKQKNQEEFCDEQEIITGDDCDDGGIADERFASPDLIMNHEDIMNNWKSGEGNNQILNNILLTSSEETNQMAQFTNYDQIKKHLEKYIQNNNQTETIQTTQSGQKSTQNLIQAKNQDKSLVNSTSNQNLTQIRKGYNRNQMAQSTGSTNAKDDTLQNQSRNGHTQKHVESLKSKVKGAFEQSTNLNDTKTPLRHVASKKGGLIAQQVNRMSIEAKDMIPGPNNIQGCLSSTAANQRTLSFSQTGFNPTSNYQSNMSLQQRKQSNIMAPRQESSIENLRITQSRQSFKEIGLANVQTNIQNINEQQQQRMKKSATGKTLQINDVQNHTFGYQQQQQQMQSPHTQQVYLKQVSSATSLNNPTFICSQTNQLTKQQQQIMQNQSAQNNQAANTVRVMTPSYSFSQLSKLITPTQQHCSPITMTVTLANNTNNANASNQNYATVGRKQTNQNTKNVKQQPSNIIQFTSNQSNTQQQMTMQNSSSQQNFILSSQEKGKLNTKNYQLINTNKNIQNPLMNKQQQIANNNQILMSQGNSKQQFMMQPSQSMGNLQQATPRGFTTNQTDGGNIKIQQNQMENSQSFSCTISTENNNSGKLFCPKLMLNLAAKTMEQSKHPKFMRTIEETSTSGPQTAGYSTMLGQALGKTQKGAVHGLSNTVSQAQLDNRVKNKVQSTALTQGNTIQKKSAMSLATSQSVTHFKSSSQQIKKGNINGKHQ